MVGNAYPYTYATWLNDVKLASAAGFDGFALNIGTDSWQWTQVASAYQAAQDSGTGFKMFLSFDMTVLPCSSYDNAAALRSYITTYAAHPNQAWYGGKILASTFAGSDCTFGQGGWTAGWQTAFKDVLSNAGTPVYFMPSVFTDPSTFGSASAMDGELNWNSGWPMGGDDLDFSSDTTYMNALGSKGYMAAVSPVFFTHYGVNSWNKNWIFRSDNWLYASRWETLVANRDKFDLIEALTWNDYGESSYIGPIEGAQPNSQAWVDGYDHTALLDISLYYATAFKTGVYPAITTDKIYLTARPHPVYAVATSDSVPSPNYREYSDDNFYALIFATSACTVTLTSGAGSQTTAVAAGVTRLSYALATGSGMAATISRNGADVVSHTPDFTFVANPTTYNFNYVFTQSS
ncbi:glycoside hydrolase [Mrakia frigida]|uniref:glycoside hydrolase family 71 protein n=1 Tax=Mrakia frigida TaxID=29902 RepID=UPI003FCC019C